MAKFYTLDIPCYMPFSVTCGDKEIRAIAVPRPGCDICVLKNMWLCADMCCALSDRRDHQAVQFVELGEPYSEVAFRTRERLGVKS